MARIHFWGAAETVTGSKYLVEANGRRVLVDCGLFQGLKKLRRRNWQSLEIDASSINAVVLTHAHIDHSGYLPRLVKEGFRGPVYCTKATYDLAQILLRDAAYLQEEDARRANKYGYSRHRPAQPLFNREDAEDALKLFEPAEFANGEGSMNVNLGADLRCEFHPAGHILGAAWVGVDVAGKRLVFSGDIGRPGDPVMKAARPLRQADFLVLESTYGDRLHPDDDFSDKLADVVNRTISRGGILLVPAFAVGRSQAIMHLLTQLVRANRIPDVPIFLNSPMAIDASNLYVRWNDLHRLSDEQCAQMCEEVTYVREAQESRELNARRKPAIIISASGMVTGGRVLHHLKAFGPDARNTILFCGYQAAGTRGQALVSGVGQIKVHGNYVSIGAEVVALDGLSAHADYAELGDWLQSLDGTPRRVFLTHGEPEAQDAFRRYLGERFGWDVDIPALGETAELR